jgi:hypothetical protein
VIREQLAARNADPSRPARAAEAALARAGLRALLG